MPGYSVRVLQAATQGGGLQLLPIHYLFITYSLPIPLPFPLPIVPAWVFPLPIPFFRNKELTFRNLYKLHFQLGNGNFLGGSNR